MASWLRARASPSADESELVFSAPQLGHAGFLPLAAQRGHGPKRQAEDAEAAGEEDEHEDGQTDRRVRQTGQRDRQVRETGRPERQGGQTDRQVRETGRPERQGGQRDRWERDRQFRETGGRETGGLLTRCSRSSQEFIRFSRDQPNESKLL
ncbi:hypothetical protein EYF80_054448 [Liparis tanakae]|uniref:Uncharacterized protein n=1 Tax=Liparis tanakae TaxID=230148 RepID=A0A4Z2F4I0_9TELE|nr:hypothetical protein EYF80_054448 [Liparis tanakae]